MTARANRSVRIAVTDQGCVDAVPPLLELAVVAGAADLNHGNGKHALAGDRVRCRRMFGEVDVGMATGAADRGMNRLRETVTGYVQRKRSAIGQRLFEARHRVAGQTLLVARGRRSGRRERCQRQQDHGHGHGEHAAPNRRCWSATESRTGHAEFAPIVWRTLFRSGKIHDDQPASFR